MDMSEPASVALSPGAAAVLRVLAGAEQSFTVRELGRLAGVSHTRASQVVREFARHGVVGTEMKGRSQLCHLNREHVAAPALTELVRLRSEVLSHIAAHIDAWQLAPTHASVFGSVARGDGGVDSDIDVLVIRPAAVPPGDERWEAQLHETADQTYRSTGNELAWFEVSIDDLRTAAQADDAIVDEWRREAIHLTGERLRNLMWAAR